MIKTLILIIFSFTNLMADNNMKNLTDLEKKVCLKQGTEAPFSGKYNKFYEKGKYLCKLCGIELFSSEHKYDSKSGWPSFFDLSTKENIKLVDDFSLGMKRVEVKCQCGSHLGHVFEDGPKPTGLRYCINSVCLEHKLLE